MVLLAELQFNGWKDGWILSSFIECVQILMFVSNIMWFAQDQTTYDKLPAAEL
jgi:hypothetical protein